MCSLLVSHYSIKNPPFSCSPDARTPSIVCRAISHPRLAPYTSWLARLAPFVDYPDPRRKRLYMFVLYPQLLIMNSSFLITLVEPILHRSEDSFNLCKSSVEGILEAIEAFFDSFQSLLKRCVLFVVQGAQCVHRFLLVGIFSIPGRASIFGVLARARHGGVLQYFRCA